MDVAQIACVELPEPDYDLDPLGDALRAAGLRCEVLAWDDPDVDWSQARLGLLRATWNYPLFHGSFLAWAERAAVQTQLWNPLPVVRWNSHKGYLRDLAERGIPITPTEFVARGDTRPLSDIVNSRGWDEIVIKPAIATSSLYTLRVGRANLEAGETHLRTLTSARDALIQVYLPAVEDYGERAIVWIDGTITHAVRKAVRFQGDVESISQETMPVTPTEARLAERTLACVQPIVGADILYGRVDVTPGPDGEPVVMELELIEPSLFFPQAPHALDHMVGAIKRILNQLVA